MHGSSNSLVGTLERLLRISQLKDAGKMARSKRRLWTCLKCGARFVTRNIYHGCGAFSVRKFLAGKGPRARRFYKKFYALVKRCGPVSVAPTKTRVAFMVRVRFAGVNRISNRGMTASFALPRKLESPRIQRVEHPVRRWYVHYFRVSSPEELDEEVLEWLRESYKMGEQRHLES